MKMLRRPFSILVLIAFLFSLRGLTACGGKKQSLSKSKVASGSGMGDKRDKNRHVWGK
jgi:hypothetical protein